MKTLWLQFRYVD